MEKSNLFYETRPEEKIPEMVNDQPLALRLLANFFSYIFHPLFIPLYAVYFLAFIHTAYFPGMNDSEKGWVLIRVAINMVFFPLITVLLLKGVGFIDSIFLKTQKERIIPYIAGGTFFFWMYLVFKNQEEIPTILTSFTFGVFISSSFALLANIYYKISMHAIGVGGLLGLLLISAFTNNAYPMALPVLTTLLITGVVCTSRLIVSNHTQKDIYMGLLGGIICQVVSAWVFL